MEIKGIIAKAKDEAILELPDILIGKGYFIIVCHKLRTTAENITEFESAIYAPEFVADGRRTAPSELNWHFQCMRFNLTSLKGNLVANN